MSRPDPRQVPRTPPDRLRGLAEAVHRNEVVFLEKTNALWPAKHLVFSALAYAALEELFCYDQTGAIWGTISENDEKVRGVVHVVHVEDVAVIREHLDHLRASAIAAAAPTIFPAYVVATIRYAADPPIVTKVDVYSESARQLTSTRLGTETFVDILHCVGITYAQARDEAIRRITTDPLHRWMLPLLRQETPPATVVAASQR